MSIKSMIYDNAAYVARLSHAFAPPAAGISAVTSKFVAFANLLIFSLTATLVTSGGTSTYTSWNGTATVTAIGAQTFSLIRIFNTATPGATPALGTATYGPYVASLYNGTATGTQTNSTATGFTVNVALSAGTNTAGTGAIQTGSNTAPGGFPVNQGDQLYVVQGTEATAILGCAMEYAIQPLASVTA